MRKKTIRQDMIGAFPTDTELTIKHASNSWENFITTGEFSGLSPTPRKVICESWIRSRSQGLDPETARAPTDITADELEEKLKQGDLGRASQSVIEQMKQSLAGTNHVIVLGDDKGRILQTVGHNDVHRQLEEINFRPGGIWSEQHVGPNGIGTPLALGRPEVIMGHEHYCVGWQPWVCYGAPIPGLYGNKPAGVVDITGPVNDIRHETMALAVSLAQSIYSGLSVLHFNRREILRSVCREKMQRWPSDGVVVIDENGYIIDYNSKASRLMSLEFPDCMENPVTQFLPDLWHITERSILDNCMEEMKMEMKSVSGGAHAVKVRVEPVLYRQENLGALLIVTAEDKQNLQSRNQKESKSASISSRYTFDNISGTSSAMQSVLAMARAAARDPLKSSVLLMGETGTGKELIAHSIHAESDRYDKPFIPINCGALPRELIESELFGYETGTFTGARKGGMLGKFEHASGGTLFLDEMDSLDADLQAKFLRVLDNNEITRIGSVQPIHVDVRVIAAASPNIISMVESDQFRSDLYHRLSVLEIEIPPLRERGEDIIDLAFEFLEKECWAAGRHLLDLSEAARKVLVEYHWPGNVRELQNLCKRWVLIVNSDSIQMEHIPEKLTRPSAEETTVSKFTKSEINHNLRLNNDELIRKTLIETDGNVSKAARILGIDRTTIYRRQKTWKHN